MSFLCLTPVLSFFSLSFYAWHTVVFWLPPPQPPPFPTNIICVCYFLDNLRNPWYLLNLTNTTSFNFMSSSDATKWFSSSFNSISAAVMRIEVVNDECRRRNCPDLSSISSLINDHHLLLNDLTAFSYLTQKKWHSCSVSMVWRMSYDDQFNYYSPPELLKL